MRIYVEEIERSGRFRACLEDVRGPILVQSSRQPLLDSARVLLKQGKTGLIEMWGGDPPSPRMIGQIENLAQWTVGETEKDIPRLRRQIAPPTRRPAPPVADQGRAATPVA